MDRKAHLRCCSSTNFCNNACVRKAAEEKVENRRMNFLGCFREGLVRALWGAELARKQALKV